MCVLPPRGAVKAPRGFFASGRGRARKRSTVKKGSSSQTADTVEALNKKASHIGGGVGEADGRGPRSINYKLSNADTETPSGHCVVYRIHGSDATTASGHLPQGGRLYGALRRRMRRQQSRKSLPFGGPERPENCPVDSFQRRAGGSPGRCRRSRRKGPRLVGNKLSAAESYTLSANGRGHFHLHSALFTLHSCPVISTLNSQLYPRSVSALPPSFVPRNSSLTTPYAILGRRYSSTIPLLL